ncbi:hypothetical protein QQS21_009045 [Conoideocrella luteorostrata]|uniref:NACHT domain-containing protein n=1 Tax=Conoideocrella luteorostrata TaxID=1105319 RepID=A0AAJ0FQM5_9HYPO|nr:hypothetical protein QQS21_009045 [Conoideocrella luteorostrata]
MDWMQPGHVIFLVGVVSISYLWIAVGIRHAARSQQQPRAAEPSPPPPPEREKNQNRQRLTIVYPEQKPDAADNAEVDIVAVHGLGSDADWSWTSKDGQNHVNWLRDLDMLPAKVPKSRIIVYSYESRWHTNAPKTRLQLCGEELVHSIHSFRAGCPSRPIVFVGHSLGGNVIVQALLYADDDDRYESLLKTTVGIVFLGTPFQGTKWQPLADSLAQLMGPAGSHRGITSELGFDDAVLRDRLHRFCKLRNRLSTSVSCFSELLETDYGRRLGIAGVAKGMVVDETSACIPGLDRYALSKDHLKINKYYGPTDPAFERVSDVISEMCRGATSIVRRRFSRREIITDNTVALNFNPEAAECLRDLFVTDPLDDRKALKRKKGDRAAGTCEWILGTEHLTTWLGHGQNQASEDQASQVLWLHGNPGTGKSTLAIFLTEALSKDFSATNGKTLAYFFCDSAFDTRNTATSIVRGLLLQLIQQHPQLLSHVLPKHNERNKNLFESFDALWSIFISAAADPNTGQKYCIIDALDECDDQSRKMLLQQLRESFYSPDAPPNVQILVTSRPYPEIRKRLEMFANTDLASFPEVKTDIDQYIKERVTQLNYTDKIRGKVAEILGHKAEGTFLWVGIACNELDDIPSKDAIARLMGMPSGLYSLYGKLYHEALKRETAGQIQDILSIVAVSLRPLNLLELSEACNLCQDEDDVETRTQFMREYIEACRLMVVIQDEKVLLLHKSVKDYLLKASETTGFSELEAHANLSYRCIDHLIRDFYKTKETHTNRDFLKYAIHEWPHHARMAQSRFSVRAPQAEFFEIDSPCRESWLQSLRRDRYWDSPPPQFSILHIAVRWNVLTMFEHICGLHDKDKVQEMIHLADSSGAAPLEYAARSGRLSILRALLDWRATMTINVIIAAVQNQTNAREVMAQLLEQRGYEITITEDVIKAAAENRYSGEDIIALLLKQRGHEITITEDVIKAAAENEYRGKEIIALLLEQRGHEIIITEDVTKAAAENSYRGEEIIALLLEQRGHEIIITEDVTKAAAENKYRGKEIIALLLEQRGHEIIITEDVIKAAAENRDYGKEIMALLLEQRGHEITITEDVIKAAAENRYCGKEVIALLLEKRGHEITITEDVIKAAVRCQRKEGVALLLEQRGHEIIITEDVIKAAAENRHRGKEIIALLLKQRGHEITITEDVIKAAAENSYRGKEIIALLLEQRGHEIIITEDVIKAAAENEACGEEIIALLLKQRGHEIIITEDVIKAAAENEDCGEDIIALLLKQRGHEIIITEDVMKAAVRCQSKEGVALLLEQRGHEITITEDVIKAAAENEDCGEDIIALLLEQQGHEITITEDVIKAAVRCQSKEGVALLLKQRGHEITITEDVMKAAVRCQSKEGVALLLEQRGHEITITEDVIKAAAENEDCGEEIMALLLKQRGHEITITEDVMKAAVRCQSKEGVALLLEQRGYEITITEDVIKAAAENRYSGEDIIALLLKQRGHEITITEDVIKAAAENSYRGKEIIALLLEQRGHEIIITENVIKAAAENRYRGKEIIALLLEQRGHEITITEDVVVAAVANRGYSQQVMEYLFEQRNDETTASITEKTLMAAATYGNEEVLKLLSQRKGLLPADDEYYRIAKLYKAAESGDDRRIEQLILVGTKPDLKNPRGETPLWVAASNGNKEVVGILAQMPDVNVNSLSNSGQSPLLMASFLDFEPVVTILLESGADPHLVDEDGDTAITVARRYGNRRIVKLLERFEQ